MKNFTKISLSIFLLLFFSYLILPYSLIWNKIDKAVFFGLNNTLEFSKSVQMFWALLNHKHHDWVIDFVYMSLFAVYIFSANGKSRKQKIFECLIVGFAIFLVIFGINKIIFRDFFPIRSLSPSLKYKGYLHLNKLITFFRTKSFSHHSFPGDHATTAILFYFLTLPLFSKSIRKFLLLYTLVITAPRLVIGAHNFTDIIFGSFPIAYISSFLIHRKRLLERIAYKLDTKAFNIKTP